MGRVAATAVHLSLCAVAGVLYFLFVIPRWWELMGDTSHTLGTVIRVVVGILIALASLPVVLTLLRTRQPELNTPKLALTLRLGAAIAHVLAGALIIGAAIAEIWLSLDSVGPWLYGMYGAAAALTLLGIFGFYLALVAELPPAPPKPKKAKQPVKEAAETVPAAETSESTEADESTTEVADSGEVADSADSTASDESPKSDEPVESADDQDTEQSSEEPASSLRNRRPSGKSGHRLRRRERGNLAVEEVAVEEVTEDQTS